MGGVIAFGTWCFGAARYHRSESHRALLRANVAEASFIIEETSDDDSSEFYVQTNTRGLPQAGWQDWRARVQTPYSMSNFMKLVGFELHGTIWFDSHSAAPIATRFEKTTLLLDKGVPTTFKGS